MSPMALRLLVIAALLAAGWSAGQARTNPIQASQTEAAGQQPTPTSPPMTEMMNEHQQMMQGIEQMDGELKALLGKMNTAQGQAKVEAIAAVVTALAEQRMRMHTSMMDMHERMMQHMSSMPGMGMGRGMRGRAGAQ